MPIEDYGSALPIGTILNEYKIESILGVGGFGITYLAVDINLDKKVVVKEYLPNDIAIRQESSKVMPKSKSDRDNFEWGLERFLQEAQTLAKFNHPNIVKVNRFFRANNSAYFVMDYEKGIDLDEYLKSYNGKVDESDIYNIIMPILDGLKEVHSVDYLHRDIKPANIFIREKGSPMLIDFGASRLAMGSKSKSLSVVLTEGYAPKEQYSSTSKQGAYTDLYAVGAVMYKMATGGVPSESSTRVDFTSDGELDPYKRLQDQKSLAYNDSFKIAVDWALSLSAKDRPQSAKEFQDALLNVSKKDMNSHKETIKIDKNHHEEKEKEKEKEENNSGMIAIIVLLVALIFGLGIWLFNSNSPTVTPIVDNSKEIEVQNAKVEAERIAKAQHDKEEADRIAQVKLDKDEADRIAQAQHDKEEVDRIAQVKLDKDKDKADKIAKAQRDEDAQREALSESSIKSFLKNYYKNINNSKYRKNYDNLSFNFKNNITYSKYYDWFSNKIEYIKLENIGYIDKSSSHRAKVKVKLYYLKKDGKFQCSEDTLTLEYNNKWLIDGQSYKNCKDGVKRYEANNIVLKVEYPLFVIKNKKALIKVSMTNNTSYTQGGVTVGFPQYSSIRLYDQGSTFYSAKNYDENSKVWSGIFKRAIQSKYNMYEGWETNWRRNKTKVLYFSLYIDKLDRLTVLLRSIMSKNKREYRNPTYGTQGQQGYTNIKIDIPVIEK